MLSSLYDLRDVIIVPAASDNDVIQLHAAPRRVAESELVAEQHPTAAVKLALSLAGH